MKSNKTTIIVALAVAIVAIAFLALGSCERYERQWDISKSAPEGIDPYDMKLFDELMTRSLTNGYEVKTFEEQPRKSYLSDCNCEYYEIPELAEISTDKGIFISKSTYWLLGPTYYYYEPIHDLILFAERGGKAVYAVSNCNELYSVVNLLNKHTHNGKVELISNSDSPSFNYKPNGFATRDSVDITLYTSSDAEILTNRRFLTHSVDFSHPYNAPYLEDYYKYLNINSKYRVYPLIKDPKGKCYALEIKFANGGSLVFTTMGIYLANLGLQLPGGSETIEYLMGQIADRPVVRYHFDPSKFANMRDDYRSGYDDDDEFPSIVGKLRREPALMFAWTLLLLLMLCVLMRGLMRRRPVARGVAAEELDKTDFVAEREHKFRRSPLLHFLFQVSWLFNGWKNYKDLFLLNYVRLCRSISHFTGIELSTATDAQLRQVAEYFAPRTGMKQSEIIEDLKWMRSIYNVQYNVPEPEPDVSVQDYKYSQWLVEQFPLI